MTEPYYRVTHERMDELKRAAIALARANRELERAREEIVALRTELRLRSSVEFVAGNELKQARAEALEEAARVCQHMGENRAQAVQYQAGCLACAGTIRALKEVPTAAADSRTPRPDGPDQRQT